MNDREVDEVLDRWAEISAKAAQVAVGSRPVSAGKPAWFSPSLATFAVVAVFLLAVLILQRPGGESPGVGGLGDASPSGAGATPGQSAQDDQVKPSIKPSEGLSARPSSSLRDEDYIAVAMTAAAFENARAKGDWTNAWSMLSPYSQSSYGSKSAFAEVEGRYNAEEGTEFTLAEPTRNPDLLDPTYLGDPGADARVNADFERAAIVFANHPNVRGASEASRAYLIAPAASGEWKVWVVR